MNTIMTTATHNIWELILVVLQEGASMIYIIYIYGSNGVFY